MRGVKWNRRSLDSSLHAYTCMQSPRFPAVSLVIWCGVEERSIKRKFNCLSVSDATNWKCRRNCCLSANNEFAHFGPGLLMGLFSYYLILIGLGPFKGNCWAFLWAHSPCFPLQRPNITFGPNLPNFLTYPCA